MKRTSAPPAPSVSSPRNMAQKESGVNIVLFGNTSSVQFGPENALLGQDQAFSDIFQVVPITRRISGHNVSVINFLGLEEAEFQHQFISDLVTENKIHAFIFVLHLHRLTHTHQTALEWLRKSFGDRALAFLMILFTYEQEEESDTIVDDLKKNTALEQLTRHCGGRYHTCSKSMNNQSEMRMLLKKVESLISDNQQCCYTAEIYNTTLRERQTQPGDHNAPHQVSKERQKSRPAPESAEDGSYEEQKPALEQLLIRMNLNGKYKHKMKMSDVLKLTWRSLHWKESCKEKHLVETFLQRILMGDYRARYVTAEDDSNNSEHTHQHIEDKEDDNGDEDGFTGFFLTAPLNSEPHKSAVHPMDLQMAVFLCSDRFLQQLIANKLAQCQYALPLLVPNPFSSEIEFPLWTFRHIRKSWRTSSSSTEISKSQAMSEAETPMVAFFRLGSVVSSKSQLINGLINEKHHTFFHRHCPGSSKNRLLLDGVVEIAWYCPSGKETDSFSDCVAFCNLHGDAVTHKEQLEILTETSSVNVVLLADPKKATYEQILQKLYRDTKPLICLFSEDDSGVSGTRKGKYRIGLKHRNQSDVAKNLRMTIKECLSKSPSTFRIKDLHKPEVITIDEEDHECQKGREAADTIIKQLEGSEVNKLKEKFLPCQGKLWHDWCRMNKDLHLLHGNNLETQKSEKQRKMEEIRREQHKYRMSALLKPFTSSLNHLAENERLFFVKWVGILLDKRTSDNLSDLLHKYNEKWTTVLDLKKKHDKSDQIKMEQNQLEEISEKLNTATFGLEHILREMGQIYESFISVQTPEKRLKEKTLTTLPKLAAELMKSGHPLELMDGDAAHVPLIWVSAVLDELVKILGDKKVFVLSILGIQSSGKSTMLNAMFGLQFAISAGRCTRGAFMQLVSVSEEMKKELTFDYLLIVDTEGLRALELAGKSTRHHDNKLATFVVGLGNLTLINIFGENPAEMQDILQIIVQAFLRMKKVRLNPSCLFVHQNVGDMTAGEQTMEGRRRLQEKLDEMTKLAAKEEGSDAQCFNDIIKFDVHSDVRYFAQLWEGSPPMAPPNPSYRENIDELKRNILTNISTKALMSLSQFKTHLSSLWDALLNENFVFSFKNTLEIAVYRKLELEYCEWSWNIRRAMLRTENKLLYRVNNEKNPKIDEHDIIADMKETMLSVEKSIGKFFDEDNDKETLIQWRERFKKKILDLYNDLVKKTKRKLDEVECLKITREKIDQKKSVREKQLYQQSKDLAITLTANCKGTDEDTLRTEFENVWDIWVREMTQDVPSLDNIDVWGDVTQTLSESYDVKVIWERQSEPAYKKFKVLGDFSEYVILNKQPKVHLKHLQPEKHAEKEEECLGALVHTVGESPCEDICRTSSLNSEDNTSVRALIQRVMKDSEEEVQRKPIAEQGYSQSYIPEIIASIQNQVKVHQTQTSKYTLKKGFTLDLCLYVCSFVANRFNDLHNKFKEANDVRVYLEKQRPQYFNIFKNFCSGATSAAVFGKFIVDKLEPSLLQAAYDQTAIEVAEKMKRNVPAFSGNKSNLEKHILTSLAEKENFENYLEYLHEPKEHFHQFIILEVNKYLEEKCPDVLETIQTNIRSKGRCVMDAVDKATEDVNKRNGNIDMWLENMTKELKDELEFKESCVEQKEMTDLSFLQEIVKNGLTETVTKLCTELQTGDLKQEMFRKKPHKVLIEHLCRCCWAQCPFCNAVCTNTMEDHDGDHRVRFHRNCGISGWSFLISENLGIDFCTTAVSSDMFFSLSGGVFLFKEYRKAGGDYARWNISPDASEMPYWKWFVCRFQEELEKRHKKKFTGSGEIPSVWRDITKEKAIESLKEL